MKISSSMLDYMANASDPRIGVLASSFLIRPHVSLETAWCILEFFHKKGYRADVIGTFKCDEPGVKEAVEQEYAEHQGKSFYDLLVKSMTTEFPNGYILLVTVRKPSNQVCLNDEDMWSVVRRLCGATNPSEALPNTIRGQFASKKCPIRYNTVHSPDSLEAARFFQERWMNIKN